MTRNPACRSSSRRSPSRTTGWSSTSRMLISVIEIMNGRAQGGRAEQFGAGDGQPAPDAAGAVPRRGVEPGGDRTSGGSLDSAFLGGEQQSVEFAPLPVVTLPPK